MVGVIQQLSVADLADNVALSHSVGWPDSEGDWRTVHQAALVLGMRQQGRLVAQGALGEYGIAASLAKMVVAPDFQRRGLGGRLLDRLLAVADERGVAVGLCATEQGRGLYESRGFSTTGELAILTGAASSGTSQAGVVVPIVDAAPMLELDRRLTGCDRSRMLCARLRQAQAAFSIDISGERGFGMVTTQAQARLSVVGPILAESERAARALAAALFAAVPGPFRIDVPLQQAAFRDWLEERGFTERAQRVEMGRGAERLPWQVEQRFALAMQAWG